MPLLNRYVRGLERRLAALAKRQSLKAKPSLSIMQSNGGVIAAKRAREEPARLVLSGPAGGIVAAWSICGGRDRPRLMTLDMGGTSTDVALLDGGEVTVPQCEVAGRPLRIPVLDIHTVGAGGGSIAALDAGSALSVGPASAGAEPGPACYGQGGPLTVTDAHVFLNRIPEGQFLGGTMRLDREATHARIHALAKKTKLSPDDLALGVLRVAEATMERALRTISLERGHDPRRFSLVAFGGAGALHAASLAEALTMPEVLVPVDPGLLSAKGMLLARVAGEWSQTVLGRDLASVEEKPERAFGTLEKKGFRAMKREGLDAEAIRSERLLDLRYAGQSFELSCRLGKLGKTRAAFDRAHEKRYGFAMPEAEVELVGLRLRVFGPRPTKPRPKLKKGGKLPAPVGEVMAGFPKVGRVATPVYAREDLPASLRAQGPAILCEYSATTVVPPEAEFSIDPRGSLVLSFQR